MVTYLDKYRARVILDSHTNQPQIPMFQVLFIFHVIVQCEYFSIFENENFQGKKKSFT